MLNREEPGSGGPEGASALERLLGGRPVTAIRWGLERTRELLTAVGHPEKSFRAIHVGGTNGKGAASAMAETVLRASGRATGLYISPHLLRFGERIQVRGRPAPSGLVETCAASLLPAASGSDATLFEVVTALAFLVFGEAGVEVAAVEVGLGGRLDATNVLTPEACAVTSVSLEHTAWLGDTVEQVAGEKAGILKQGVPAALGPVPAAAGDVFEENAARVGAPLRRLGREARVEDVRVDRSGTGFRYVSEDRPGGLELSVPLPGVHQAFNAATALLALDATRFPPPAAAVRMGLERVRWPGRFQILDRRGGTWVVDVAHNPAALASTLDTLGRVGLPEPHVALLSILSDKDWGSMVASARAAGLPVVLTSAPSAPEERRWDPAAAHARSPEGTILEPGFAAALERARELAGRGTVLVAGSCSTAADALRALDATDEDQDQDI